VQSELVDELLEDEALLECLLRVATRLAQFERSSRFSTWAWKVAVNRILELKRRPFRTVEQFYADLADGLELEAPERPEDLVALGELKMGCGRALLNCLEPDERIAFIVGEISCAPRYSRSAGSRTPSLAAPLADRPASGVDGGSMGG